MILKSRNMQSKNYIDGATIILRNFARGVGEDGAFPSLVMGKAESDPMRRKKRHDKFNVLLIKLLARSG